MERHLPNQSMLAAILTIITKDRKSNLIRPVLHLRDNLKKNIKRFVKWTPKASY